MTILLSFLTYGPYHIARLEAAQSLGLTLDVEVFGLAMARLDSEYSWQTPPLQDLLLASKGTPLDYVPANEWVSLLGPILDESEPDLCAIAGYSHPAMIALITLCAKRSIPWILMSDSRESDLPRKWWKEWVKGRLVKLASSGFAAGKVHIDYLEKLGLSRAACYPGYDVVDNGYFKHEADRWRNYTDGYPQNSERMASTYFLSSNRFIPEKNLFRLLSAYAEYTKSPRANPNSTWPLCLLGDGELNNDLIAHASQLGLTIIERAPWEPPERTERLIPTTPPCGLVWMPGFRQIDELPRFYAYAGGLILASTKDTWGLVVNEAMASSLPVLVSNRCGCAAELVHDNENGFLFDPLSVSNISEKMLQLSNMSEEQRAKLGEAGETIIAEWGLDRFATGLHHAGETALQVGPKRLTLLDRLTLKAIRVLGAHH